jgi:hypothetical protein
VVLTKSFLLAAVLLAACSVPGQPTPVARSTQVSFEPVSTVPHCADYFGTGPLPAEGHAALFVQPPDADTMYFAAELVFDDTGWVAEDVLLGEAKDTRHFTLHLHAVSETFLAWLERLPPRYLINRLPMRLLDSLIAIRVNGPDTC